MTADRAELVARFGSPLYVYDLDRLHAAQADLAAALPEGVGIYFSLKANPHPLIGRALRESPTPSRAEVCSAGELASALEAGYPAAEILYGGPGKTAAEIDAALDAGVRRMSVESLGDLERIGDVARHHDEVVECLLRINAAAAASVTSIRMTGVPSQFGLDAETVPALKDRLLGAPGTRVVGFHFYPLSNSRDEESLLAELRQSVELAGELRDALGIEVERLDLGGGFSAPYASSGARPVYEKLRLELAAALDVTFPGWRDGAPDVACESGRYLTGDCGELITTVTNVKISRGTRYLVMDAGVNTFGGMAGLGRMLPIEVAVDGVDPDRPRSRANLAGPLCTPGDLLGRNVEVADLVPGELIVVPNAGAYGASASLVGFLSRPPAAEVFLAGGQVVAATRTETRRIPIEG